MQKDKLNKGTDIPINKRMKKVFFLPIVFFFALSNQAVSQEGNIFSKRGESSQRASHR